MIGLRHEGKEQDQLRAHLLTICYMSSHLLSFWAVVYSVVLTYVSCLFNLDVVSCILIGYSVSKWDSVIWSLGFFLPARKVHIIQEVGALMACEEGKKWGIHLEECKLWASLVAQTVKNLPAMWESRVWSLGWGASLENICIRLAVV